MYMYVLQDAMMALNSELQLSQGTIGALKTSVRDVSKLNTCIQVYIYRTILNLRYTYVCSQLVTQNQELVEKNVSLQEVTAEVTRYGSTVYTRRL